MGGARCKTHPRDVPEVESTMSKIPVLRVPTADRRPDGAGWVNRFEIKSSSSNSRYTISQSEAGRFWACSCMAWTHRRTCKHIVNLGLPAFAAPLDVALEVTAPVSSFEELVARQERSSRSAAPAPRQAPKPAVPKNKPPVMLAETWDGKSDPTGWWVSEKFDGVRAWWDGKDFISRDGNVFQAPAWFKAQMPRTVLDGELFLGRGKLSATVSIVRSESDKGWRSLTFQVFDAPDAPGTFEQRLVAVYTEVQLASCPWLVAVQQTPVKSEAHLRALLAAVEAEDGEGLMIRRPGSAYPRGVRSTDCLKVLTVHTAEAVVIGHTAGKGNRDGGTGALLCRLPNGVEFKVGTGLKTSHVKAPPPIGTVITFGYKRLTENGKPRDPRFIRVREKADT
jgi:DNA ligase-1